MCSFLKIVGWLLSSDFSMHFQIKKYKFCVSGYKKLKVQFINAYVIIEIDFSISSCSMESSD